MNWSALDWGILGPALVAGLLVLATHVPLGMQVLDRGIVFIDLAIAQIAGLGVIAADAVGLPEHGIAVQAAAVSAALLGAWLLTWTERRAPQQQEALIGVHVHPRRVRRAAAAGRQPAWRRASQGPARRPDPVGEHDAARSGSPRSPLVLLAAIALGWIERLGRFGFYGAVRARRDRLGAAGRRLPRVLEPDRSGARDQRDAAPRAACPSPTRSARPATPSASRSRRCSTCRRAR